MTSRADIDGFIAEKTLAIHGHCILMFAHPSAFIHRAHRWVWQMIGRVPA